MFKRLIKVILVSSLLLSLNAFLPAETPASPAGGLAKVGAQEEEITLVAVGDIMLAGRLASFIEEYGPAYPYKYTTHILKEADISFANLESPLSTKGEPVPEKEYAFRADPKVAEGLKDAGFDVLSLANNHILDYGEEALFETIEVLDSQMIRHIGAGKNIFEARRLVILKVRNKRFGFLAYSNTLPEEFWAEEDKAGTAYGKFSHVKEDVKELKEKVDFLIVSFHWGNEEKISPQEYQRNLAHLAIDQGADIILGHHPHILSGIETYRNGVIIYSLGNFAFGSYSERAKESAIFRFILTQKRREDRRTAEETTPRLGVSESAPLRLQRLEIIPISVYNKEVKFQPRILKDKEAERVLEETQELSKEFDTKIKIENSKGIITFSE